MIFITYLIRGVFVCSVLQLISELHVFTSVQNFDAVIPFWPIIILLDLVLMIVVFFVLAAFVFYSLIVGSSFGTLSEVIGELQRAAGAAERIGELLRARNAIVAPEQPQHLPQPVQGRIELQGVRFAYPSRSDSYAIDGIDLQVAAGETLALVGPSGAGKSTLFDLLLRFFDPQGGRILIDGVPIDQLDPRELRASFALVSQNPALFFGSVEDNIRYGRLDASQAEVEAAARAAHAHD